MVFRPRRMGGSFSRGAKFGGGIRKSSVGSVGNGTNFGGQTSVGNNSISGNSSSCGQVASAPVFSQNKKTGRGMSTGLSQRKKWGFYDALVGQQRETLTKEQTTLDKTFVDEIKKIKYKIVDDKNVDGGIIYKKKGYKRGEIHIGKSLMDNSSYKNRKKIAKQIKTLSKKGGLRQQLGKMRNEDENIFVRNISGKRIDKIGRKANRSGKIFSKGVMSDLFK